MVLVLTDWFGGYEIASMDMRFAQHPPELRSSNSANFHLFCIFSIMKDFANFLYFYYTLRLQFGLFSGFYDKCLNIDFLSWTSCFCDGRVGELIRAMPESKHSF